MGYTVNQPQYPAINTLQPDFYALKLIIPGLYAGTIPVGLRAIDYGDKLTKGKVRGNSQVLLGKTPGKYEVGKCSLTMLMNDFYNGFLPFIGNLGQPQGLGAYEVAFGFDLVYSTANDPQPKSVQIVGASIGEVNEKQKESETPLEVVVDLDEPFMLVRNGVVPAALAGSFWPTNVTDL
jgi:hypothetical protein